MAEAYIGQRLEGTVTSFRAQWGWVSCPQTGGDLFAHIGDVVEGVLAQGAEVSFEVGVDSKTGKPRALQIQVAASGTPPAGAGSAAASSAALPQEERLEGTVLSWKEPWGWLTCPSTEGDVFAHRDDVANGDGFPLQVGCSVTFALGADTKTGRARALEIHVADTGRVAGTVTSWKDKWGWVTCPSVPDGDVFAHVDDLTNGAPLEVGVKVSFELGEDERGRRRARSIVTAGGGAPSNSGGWRGAWGPPPAVGGGGAWGPPPGGGGFGFGGGDPWGGGGWAPASPAGTFAGYDNSAEFVGRQMTGCVVSWSDKWGWVQAQHVSKDIFAHLEDLRDGAAMGPPEVGATLRFTVGVDPKGRVRALDIRRYGGGGCWGSKGGGGAFDAPALPPSNPGKRPAPAAVAATVPGRKGGAPPGAAADAATAGAASSLDGLVGQALEGEVISWRSPWGWIRCRSRAGGADVFAHADDLAEGAEVPAVGDSVAFVLDTDEKSGRWRARSIAPAAAAASPPAAKRPRPAIAAAGRPKGASK